MYDHPFQWGSKRTGPDLARIGGRYSDDWHIAHFQRPQDLVPESIMPAYPWLIRTPIGSEQIAAVMRASRMAGVPYSDEMIASARSDFRAQADPDVGDVDGLLARYPKAQARNFDGQPGVSELDAVIAYLQVLGTLVDFSTFTPDASR
jgi:cytochrome c oxidase cbb3-type subunit 2